MSISVNRRIVLAARPSGEPKESDFRLEEVPLPVPAEGQVLLRNLYLSLDPYMRGRMNDGPSYAAATVIGGVMTGGTVSRVIESKSAAFQPGDLVSSFTGWQEYAVAGPETLRKLDPGMPRPSQALGVLGMPSLTAYAGMKHIGLPKPGETVVVGAASGAVGSIVGQIAKRHGCRAVGIAGTPEKCSYVVNDLGFDACLNHRDADLASQLAAACPKGIDIYFENVGGLVFDAVFPLLNVGARVPVCGVIAHYNATQPPPGPDRVPQLMIAMISRRLTFRGFLVSDFIHEYPDFIRDMSAWMAEGAIIYREDIVDGLDQAVTAFQGLLQGKNFGKLVVRIDPQAP